MKLKNLAGLATQLAFGVDTLVGLSAYMLLSFLFHEPANIWFLMWAGFCAYLPDFDLVIFIWLSKEQKKWGHWRLGFHHPILFIPLVGISAWWISSWLFPTHELFLTTLALVCVIGHLVHDSTGEAGLHWFSTLKKDWWRGGNPFSWFTMNPLLWTFIQITKEGARIVPQHEVVARYKRTARIATEGKDIEARLEKVTRINIVCFCVCLIGLGALALTVGVTL